MQRLQVKVPQGAVGVEVALPGEGTYRVDVVREAKKRPPRRFLCDVCNDDLDFFMLHDHIWEVVKPPSGWKGMLCWACAEQRLGRPLHRNDFKPCVSNRVLFLAWDRAVASTQIAEK